MTEGQVTGMVDLNKPAGFRITVSTALIGLTIVIVGQVVGVVWWASGLNTTINNMSTSLAKLDTRDEVNRTTAELARSLQSRVENLERDKVTTTGKLDNIIDKITALDKTVGRLQDRIEEDQRGRKGASYDPPDRSGGLPKTTLGPR